VVTWSAFADFTELDVHHQYAIAFRYSLLLKMFIVILVLFNNSLISFFFFFFNSRTPPYRDQNIQSAVPVQFQLYRPSNEDVSEPKLFTYTPRESIG